MPRHDPMLSALRLAGKEKSAGVLAPDKAIAALIGKLSSIPAKATGGSLKNMLLGKTSKFGRMAGSRLRPKSGKLGSSAWAPVSEKEYKLYKAGKLRGEVVKGRVDGRAVYFRRKYQPGGVVGLAAKYPGRTLATGGLAYMLATSPTARSVGSSLIPRGPKTGATEETTSRFNEQMSARNPLAGSTWG